MQTDRMDLDGVLFDRLAVPWQAPMAAFGTRDGAPHVVVVADDGSLVHVPLPGTGRVTSIAPFESVLLGVETEGEPPTLLEAWMHPRDDQWVVRDLSDEEDELPNASRVWLACGSEDPGFVMRDSAGLLRGVELGADLLPTSPELHLDTPHMPLLVGQGESEFYLAGPIRVGDDAPRQSLWTMNVYETREIDLATSPDGFTDIVSTTFAMIAGHGGGRPLLWTSSGRALDAPPARLDPQHPMVCVARHPKDGATPRFDWASWEVDDSHPEQPRPPHVEGTMVALQSVDGPQLWSRTAGTWTYESLPVGRLQAARHAPRDGSNWAILDGELWRITC